MFVPSRLGTCTALTPLWFSLLLFSLLWGFVLATLMVVIYINTNPVLVMSMPAETQAPGQPPVVYRCSTPTPTRLQRLSRTYSLRASEIDIVQGDSAFDGPSPRSSEACSLGVGVAVDLFRACSVRHQAVHTLGNTGTHSPGRL